MSQSSTTKTLSDRSRVWVYFKQCDGDPYKVRCNLCFAELANRGSSTTLWNHIKFKHNIDRNKINQELKDKPSESLMASTKLRNNTATNLRQKLDFIDYNDISLTSMKPLPSTSLSKNLMSRLNQLSSPVTRKLKFWNKKSFQVNQYDPSFKVIYLGNLGMQLWSKEESCLDKPLSTLWNNYLVNMKTEIVMRLTICNSGLKAITRQHGLTQYWSNRLIYCCSHKKYPRIFSWVYRHEGKKMRQELRCHAVFCPTPEKASKMVTMLNQRLACALQEFRREKKSRGISIINDNSIPSSQNKVPRTIPLRRQILEKGSANFRPPLERSKSAPKLTSIIEEDYDSEDDDASHDEFEFEESFGDRDDSDYEEQSTKYDEDSTQKYESNSLTTTVNEENSNSSVYATGDKNSTYDKQEATDQPHNTNPSGSPVESNLSDRLQSNPSHQTNAQTEDDELQTKETTVVISDDDTNSHKTSKNHRLSANINTSSSFQTLQVTDQDTRVKENEALPIFEAKNNNNSSNIKEPQPTDQADDISTQEIILSWSNLVIK